MDDPEPSVEIEVPARVELEVDPFESIVDGVSDPMLPLPETKTENNETKDSIVVPDDEKNSSVEMLGLKLEPDELEIDVVQEKPKKKRGRPKKTRTYSKNSSSSDDLPLKKTKSNSGVSDVKSENSQEGASRRSYRSKRPSSFVTKYASDSGSEDEKIAFKGVQLSDDEYTPDKAIKGKRKKRYDSSGTPINGNAVKNLSDDIDSCDLSQDGLDSIKIESVSSIKKITDLSVSQMDAATLFLTHIMKSTANLGTFVQSKAEEFINVRLTPGFMTDLQKLQFCVEKSFKLLELIKNNLKTVDTELKENYIKYIMQHKLERDVLQDKDNLQFLSEHKILFEKIGTKQEDDSDSDCAIVAEIPSTPKKSLDILRKVERNGISWKTHRGSISSQCSDGSTKILIPGKSTIFLNRNIQVKKVPKKPQFESFFREDGRTLKPPDDKINNFKTRFKIKKLDKNTLILGWLDLAYRKVNKQFYDIVKEFERREHYDSCSDLGESCSDEDSDDEQQNQEAYYDMEMDFDFQTTNPKTLSTMCLDQINNWFKPVQIVSFQSLDEQFRQIAKTLKKYYSVYDQLFTDDPQLKSPASLLQLCINSVNSSLLVTESVNLINEFISNQETLTKPFLKHKDHLTSFNKTENKENIEPKSNETEMKGSEEMVSAENNVKNVIAFVEERQPSDLGILHEIYKTNDCIQGENKVDTSLEAIEADVYFHEASNTVNLPLLDAINAMSIQETSKADASLLEADKAGTSLMDGNIADVSVLDASKKDNFLLEANETDTSLLQTNKADVSIERANEADISLLETNKADVSIERANEADISLLETNKADVSIERANEADISLLETNNADVSIERANEADDSIEGANEADISLLQTNKADVSIERANEADISLLETNKADVSIERANEADISLLETNKADVSIERANEADISLLETNKADVSIDEVDISLLETNKAGVCIEGANEADTSFQEESTSSSKEETITQENITTVSMDCPSLSDKNILTTNEETVTNDSTPSKDTITKDGEEISKKNKIGVVTDEDISTQDDIVVPENNYLISGTEEILVTDTISTISTEMDLPSTSEQPTMSVIVKKELMQYNENEIGHDYGEHADPSDNDAEDPMLQVTYEVYLDENKVSKKSKKAMDDLLESSSSDEGNLLNPRKKKAVGKKRGRKPKQQQTDTVTEDSSKKENDWIICNHLIKEDRKLNKVCEVRLQRLTWDVIKPLHDEIENEQEDFEIDKLLDFSTLAPTSKTKSLDDETQSRLSPSLSKKSTTKQVKEKGSSSDSSNLLDLITSGAVDEVSDGDDELSDRCEESPGDQIGNFLIKYPDKNVDWENDDKNQILEELLLKSSAQPVSDSLENLAKKHKEKSNISAKNLLILSSSSDGSDQDDAVQQVTLRRKTKPNTKAVKSNEKPDTPEKGEKKDKRSILLSDDLKQISSSSDSDSSVIEVTSSPSKPVKMPGEVALDNSDDDLVAVEGNSPQNDEVEKAEEVVLDSSDGGLAVVEAPPSPEDPDVSAEEQVAALNCKTKTTTSTSISEVSTTSKEKKVKEKKRKTRRKKMKIVTESDEERKKFQKKRKRLSKKEEKKTRDRFADDSSDNDSVLSLSSLESELSVEESFSSYQPSSQRENDRTEYFTPVIKREPGLEHTSPRTKNRRAHVQSKESSDEEEARSEAVAVEEQSDDDLNTGRKKIRKMLDDECLLAATKRAAREEEERVLRVVQKNTQLSKIMPFVSPSKEKETSPSLVLDVDMETKEPLLSVHPTLVKIMKEHQTDGVKFMWDTCFESVKMVKQGVSGGGCILAHCMGLGKSLQVISLVHALLTSDLPFRTVLICCPLSTVLNWADEFKKWLRKINSQKIVKIYELSKYRKHYERSFHLEDWHRTGGVFIMGYEMFRLLTTLKESPDCKSHVIKKISGTLLNPGPDIVVCDEGHLLKNDNTTLAKIMYKIRSKRRIVLTGTPLQNNLKEYYCMVNFVKPNLLGSRKEYSNRFENPILNGQHRDSSDQDIKVMKKRSHVLHKMLEGCVQRKEATLLYKYLPRKREFVLLVTLSECQAKIYRHYLSKYAKGFALRGTPLLKDFHTLQKIWTHPRTLHKFFIKSRENKLRNKPKEKFTVDRDGVICLEDEGDVAEETLAAADDTDWWMDYVTQEEMENLDCSPKFSVALQLLEESLQAGDKMLVFSTSLFTLDALEFFLRKNKDWVLGKHYYRLDGSVTLENRQKWCRNFNSERNTNVKLFLISTRAGGLGINMIAANRVIIMDVSWNPSHDIQSIFRVYRFGQKKDCYIYRLVAMGTMEEKIYERSVTKQAISLRVVDEQQIDRHYNTAELSELYTFNPVPEGQQPVPSIPSDNVLAAVLATSIATNIADDQHGAGNKKVPLVWSLHEHDSLLRDLREEQLPEEERVAAWLEYQAEREQQKNEREKRKAAANVNCIIPDTQFLPMRQSGVRSRKTYRKMLEEMMMNPTGAYNPLLPSPISTRNINTNSGGICVERNLVPWRPNQPRPRALPSKPYTLGSYSAMLPLDGNNAYPMNKQLERNDTYPIMNNQPNGNQYRLVSTSYELPMTYNDVFVQKYGNESRNTSPFNPIHQEVEQTQGGWVLPKVTSDIYCSQQPSTSNFVPQTTESQPKAAKPPKKRRSSAKNQQPQKAIPSPVNEEPESLLSYDQGHVVYLPSITNGYNSSEAESIVPDCDDSSIETIELD